MTHSNYPIIPKLQSIPADLVSLEDYSKLAHQFIPEPVYTYIRSGVADEITLKANHDAYEKISLYNRVLGDFSQATTATTIFGQSFRHPILLAPVAHQGLVHDQGELASAEAADAMEAGMIVSTMASQPLEAIVAASRSPMWFQLYFQTHREDTLALLKRAEAAGYQAIVITVDVPINGLRNEIQRAGFQLPYTAQAIHGLQNPNTVELSPEQSIIFQGLLSTAPTWKDIEWLREHTTLPILLKGISHADDAKQAIAIGLNGIIVSNHGGRSLDTIPAAIHLLPAIRQALGPNATILIDGGIRRGSDIFKALALGANATLIGRPQVYGLAVAGALGVAHTLKILRDELEVTMALCGCTSIKEINSDCLFRETTPC